MIKNLASITNLKTSRKSNLRLGEKKKVVENTSGKIQKVERREEFFGMIHIFSKREYASMMKPQILFFELCMRKI